MPDFVLEIGTEEVPASAVVPALDQLAALFRELLGRERLGFEAVRTVGTPRRLVAYVTGVAERQPDSEAEYRGPARRAAFDAEGNPTKAAEGFARKYGLSAADLEVRETDGGEYVYARQRVVGRPTAEVLAAAIPGLLGQLNFPKFMRWGEGRYRFSRPIRWLLALLGEEVVSFDAGGVTSGRVSHGHRFLPVDEDGGHTLEVARAEEYFRRMEAARVVVDPAERRQRILDQGNALAAADGVSVVWDEALLHDVVFTVEYPTAFMGAFPEQYLELPRPVLVSAMRKHQRYFYLEGADGSLAPRFLACRNGGEHGLDVVRSGNERVLVFRFNDAVHHHQEDLKTSLGEKRERLKRIVFMEKLGTMWDKSHRLETMAGALCDHLEQPGLRETTVAAARLCKADLSSAMVAELPELQGVIGCEYGLREGLEPAVTAAIAEHYQPKAGGDPLPASLPGRLLALADRLDLLTAAFSLGHVPTGSSDPFGLRRAAAGSVALLRELPAGLHLTWLIDQSLAAYGDAAYYHEAVKLSPEVIREELLRFFRPRVEALLEEEGVRLDLVEATLGAGFESIPGTLERARFLKARAGTGDWDTVVATGTRLRNILKHLHAGFEANLDLLQHETEMELRYALRQREGAIQHAAAAGDWAAAWAEWSALVPLVDRFFVDVLVNVEDEELRRARQGLLWRLDQTFLSLADFSKIAAV